MLNDAHKAISDNLDITYTTIQWPKCWNDYLPDTKSTLDTRLVPYFIHTYLLTTTGNLQRLVR